MNMIQNQALVSEQYMEILSCHSNNLSHYKEKMLIFSLSCVCYKFLIFENASRWHYYKKIKILVYGLTTVV